MATILRINGATRTLGKSQGYIGLPLRDEVLLGIGTLRDDLFLDGTRNKLVPSMTTAWELTPDEIRRHIDGAPLMLRLLGNMHPPVMLYVGDE